MSVTTAGARAAGLLLSPDHVVHLRTTRLVMRRFTANDGDLLVELDSDPEVVRWVGMTEPTTLAVFANRMWPSLSGWYAKHENRGYWATHEAATGAFIGWFHYRPMREAPHDLELGYRLRRASWGKGYATEGSRALLGRGFDELGDVRVTAEAFRENRASTHVMDKLGMVFERSVIENGLPVDWYAIDAQRWAAARRG